MNQLRQVSFRRAPVFGGDVRNVFETFFGSDIAAPTASASAWAPRVDIREEDGRFLILADVPGVDLADIEIQMDKNVLSIKGERKAYASEAEGKFSRVERAAGAFKRSFTLPESADAEGITASGGNGVLEIAIPKKAQSAPRRIAINTAG
ncbi:MULTISPECIES: Hsp20/alpha crystallin family protein [unclassified Luteibacter]|uniref:Hsp20/alpha crystallin family protein n=1 Tax=unclassified Luteibacter TaxID=2620188 RepID=UPI0008C99985|nr:MULTISPECIES: Hsp20/alpha crystallin family protein [unclassified Luteibacter]MDR6935266.1 HSP20 family protein [Luteibacter sp. 3190]SEO77968.1 HSP20 family protein [Luteibacter sp. UNC138MFCol5.1]SEV97332.1 heat shock protein Hsp20 [Luteibacter sp. 329MFSha]